MSTAFFLSEETDEMKLREDDKQWLRSEIATQVGIAIKDSIDSLRPQKWRRVAIALREWGLAGTAITGFIGMIGIVLAAGYFIIGEVIENAQFRGSTTESLKQIRADITELQAGRNPQKALEVIGGVEQESFARFLPALNAVTAHPVLDVQPNEGTLVKTRIKLQAVPESTKEYWPTVLRFIAWMSAKNQDKVPPPGEPTTVIARNIGYPGLGTIKNEVVLLDSGELGPTTFVDSRIIFKNLPVKMRNVRFVDCVFQLPADEQPSDYLKTAARQLLATNLDSTSLTIN